MGVGGRYYCGDPGFRLAAAARVVEFRLSGSASVSTVLPSGQPLREGNAVAHGSEQSGPDRRAGASGPAGTTESPDGATNASRGSQTVTTGAGANRGTAATSAAKPLKSLSPSFDPDQHATYLQRLEEAVKDPGNRNIALTGRYGAGKSSVLDEFLARHPESSVRLAISSLAPGKDSEEGHGGGGGGDGESTTNQIQKEIVKQLLYGASEKVGKNSRFRKIAVLSTQKAIAQSAAFVVCLGGLLYLFGWLPPIRGTVDNHEPWVQALSWALVAALATGVATVVRVLTTGRFWVSEVSAGGAALTLDESPDSYFDKFLDEIVYYFGRESKDVVIFEDLDRFEDPGIFENLRELNLLLNETPERRRRREGNRLGRALRSWLSRKPEGWRSKAAAKLPERLAVWLLGTGAPLRFVYALRDSVFEKLDASTALAALKPGQPIDAAAAETLRANRTKFFDIVISIVPFISHRTARDLLLRELQDRGIVGVESRLVNTVAQHCPDMRLLRNMCNEYLLFAERLLEPTPPAKSPPGMDASHLFALVAYKNFHLEDFENISRRSSHLDDLYELHQRLVRDNIAQKAEQKRTLLAGPAQAKTHNAVATTLGTRLTAVAELVRRASTYSSYPALFRIGSEDFDVSAVTGDAFWVAVAKNKGFNIMLGGTVGKRLDEAELGVLFPEALDADRWRAYDESAALAALADIEADIEALRGAGFEGLAKMPRFTLHLEREQDPAPDGGMADPQTFSQLLDVTLKSDLARDLVRRGHIDRNFTLYSAQFYGSFTGLDVANFMVRHVQTNSMAIDYDLSRKGAVANLLEEAQNAGEELMETVAAYNVDIVNHLLAGAHTHRDADIVVDNLVAGWGSEDARTFLAAYLTTETAEREKLVGRLARRGCREIFAYLASDDDVPASVRAALFSAAACEFDLGQSYDLDDNVRAFITDHYGAMQAFTRNHPGEPSEQPAERVPERLNELLARAGVVIPELRVLGERLCKLVVKANRYRLDADNLRVALGVTGSVPLDRVQGDESIYEYCLDESATYLAAVKQDTETKHTVCTRQSLVRLLIDVDARWDENADAQPAADTLSELLTHASSDARLGTLREVPKSTWTAAAAAELFPASLANVEDYRNYVGTIDGHLAAILERAGTVHVDAPGDVTDSDGDVPNRQQAAVAILNATQLDTAVRVNLAASVGAITPLPLDDITTGPDDLFAQLIGRGMVEDDLPTFIHLREGGWAALGPAIQASTGIETFLQPAVLRGMVAELLGDSKAARKVGPMVACNVEEFVLDDDWTELKAVVRYADTQRVALSPDTVVRIARVAHEHGDVDKTLLLRTLVATNPTASADQIVAVFEHLGPDHDKIRQTGEKLKFDRNDTNDRLLRVLQDARVVERGGTGKYHYSATVV